MTEINCRPAQAQDMTRVKEIIRLSFEQAAENPDVVEDLENETWCSWHFWLVAEREGQVVSALGLRPGLMWISGVDVSTATVGTFCTHPAFRGRGIGYRLMRFADEVMKERDVVLARLHTSAERFAFYGRCGYVKAVQDWGPAVFDVDRIGPQVRARAETALGEGLVRPAHARDAMRMNEIYEATFCHGTGHLSRNEHFFLRRIGHWPKMWFWHAPKIDVIEDPKEGVCGYIACDVDENRRGIVELATLPRQATRARTLILHAGRRAQEAGIRKMDVDIDRSGLLGWVVHELRMGIEPDSGVMFLKVQDEERFVSLMKPLVERRAEQFEVELTMNLAGVGHVTMGRGRKVRITTDVAHLATLIYNGAWLAGLMGQGALTLEPETLAAHQALREVFPDTHARQCRLDSY